MPRERGVMWRLFCAAIIHSGVILTVAASSAVSNVTLSMTVKKVPYALLAKHGSPWLPRFNSIVPTVIADEAMVTPRVVPGDISLDLAPLAASDSDVVVWVQIGSSSPGALRGSLWASAASLADKISNQLAATDGLGPVIKDDISIKDLRVYQSPITAWEYNGDVPMGVRALPKLSAKITGQKLQSGTSFHVSEERHGPDGILYLRLADGSGWVFEGVPGLKGGCVRKQAVSLVSTNKPKEHHNQQHSSKWQYIGTVPFALRSAPVVSARLTGNRIQPQELLDVSEEKRGSDGVLYLKLAKGWAFEQFPGMGKLCERVAALKQPGPVSERDHDAVETTVKPAGIKHSVPILPTSTAAHKAQGSSPREVHDYSNVRQWRYIGQVPLAAHKEPSMHSRLSGIELQPGGVFQAVDQHRGSDGILYLKLSETSGWVFEKAPGVQGQSVPYAKAPLGSGVWSRSKAAKARGDHDAIENTLDAPYQPAPVADKHGGETRLQASNHIEHGNKTNTTTVTVHVTSQAHKKHKHNAASASEQEQRDSTWHQRMAPTAKHNLTGGNTTSNANETVNPDLHKEVTDSSSQRSHAVNLPRAHGDKQTAGVGPSQPGVSTMHIPWLLFAVIALLVAFGMTHMQNHVFQSHVWPTLSVTIPVAISAFAFSSLTFPCLEFVLKESPGGLSAIILFGLTFALFAVLRVALIYYSDLHNQQPRQLLKISPTETKVAGTSRNEMTCLVTHCGIAILTSMAGMMATRAGVVVCASIDGNANLEPSDQLTANGELRGGSIFPAVLAPIFLQQAVVWAMFAFFRIAQGSPKREISAPDSRLPDDGEYYMAEDLVAGLSFSFLAVQSLCIQQSSGTYATIALSLLGSSSAVVPPVTQKAIASLGIVGVVAAVGMLAFSVMPTSRSGRSPDDFSTERLLSTAQTYCGMIIMWCCIFVLNAEVKDLSFLDIQEYASLGGQFLLALVATAGGLLIVYILSKILGAATPENSVRQVTTVLGGLLGFCWGSCFESITTAIADATAMPLLFRFMFLAIITIPLVYLWCRQILPRDPNCSLLYSKAASSSYSTLPDRKSGFNV